MVFLFFSSFSSQWQNPYEKQIFFLKKTFRTLLLFGHKIFTSKKGFNRFQTRHKAQIISFLIIFWIYFQLFGFVFGTVLMLEHSLTVCYLVCFYLLLLLFFFSWCSLKHFSILNPPCLKPEIFSPLKFFPY